MRKTLVVLLAAVLMGSMAVAELQNVQVGGSIRIRGNWYMNQDDWNDDIGNTLSYVEQRTRLNVKADFSDGVAAFIELDSYDLWGDDFRSNYITGVDTRARTFDDVEIYQAYVEANDMFDQPLRLRIGRQEMPLGGQWLVGVNDVSSANWNQAIAGTGGWGLSFDAVRLTYESDTISVDAFMAKLADTSPAVEDSDIDFYGVYGSYIGIEDITIDAYWLFLRDPLKDRDLRFRSGPWYRRTWKDSDAIQLHTVGLRSAGVLGAVDYEAEVAYQFGDAERYMLVEGADFEAFAANLEVGYTFDTTMVPRIYVGGCWFEGPDGDAPAFNRLFSNWEYSEFLDQDGSLSNVWLVRGGIQAMPTESIELAAVVTYFETLDAFEAPAHITLWGRRFPVAGPFTFWTMRNSKGLGVEAALYATYHYSEDLTFEAGWAHLFTSSGLTDGQFVLNNGLGFTGGTSDKDADYLYLEARINF